MAKTALDYYKELLTEEPIVVSVAGLAAFAATCEELAERGEDDFAFNAFMTRVDENLETLAEHLNTLQ